MGYGEAILFELHRNGWPPFIILLDCGGNEPEEFPPGSPRIRAGDYLEHAGIKWIDLLICSHVHEDHVCGFAHKIGQLPIRAMWGAYLPDPAWPALSEASSRNASTYKFICALNAYGRMCGTLLQGGAALRTFHSDSGQVEICEGLTVEILGPQPENIQSFVRDINRMYAQADLSIQQAMMQDLDARMNNNSLILRMHYMGRSLLFSGDTNRDGYQALLAAPHRLRADVFKAGHHGQADSMDDTLMKAVDPDALLLCASSDCRYGSMHPDILALSHLHGKQRGRPVRLLLTDVPDLPPYTDRMRPHSALTIVIDDNGTMIYDEVLI